MPTTLGIMIEILITLSEDENEEVSCKSKHTLAKLSQSFSSDEFKQLLENLEEGFYGAVTSLPRIFNGIGRESFYTKR